MNNFQPIATIFLIACYILKGIFFFVTRSSSMVLGHVPNVFTLTILNDFVHLDK